MISSRRLAIMAWMRAATSGAMRWRCVSHQGRACSRNLSRRRGLIPRQILCVCGRSPSTTLRQSPPVQPAPPMHAREANAGDGKAAGRTAPRARRSARDPPSHGPPAAGRGAKRRGFGPRCPRSSSASAVSTIVSPVPRIRSVGIERSAAADGLGPRADVRRALRRRRFHGRRRGSRRRREGAFLGPAQSRRLRRLT